MIERTATSGVGTQLEPRRVLGRFLIGRGLEIGPGESPFPLDFGGAEAVRVDQWSADEARQLFQEVAAQRFSEPDHQLDLNVDRLSAFPDASQDFVIASHVLEHLVEPIGQLQDIWRVLRPGGVLLLFLPDRRLTFDRDRAPTPLTHLIDEYQREITELDDAHLAEFVENVPEDWGDAPPPKDQAERFARHRQRSIHVHCWTEDEFAEVLEYQIEQLGTPWELLDRLGSEDVPRSIEFGLVLRRPASAMSPVEAAERFRRVRDALRATRGRANDGERVARGTSMPLGSDPASVGEIDARLADCESQLALRSRELESARESLRQHERYLAALRRLRIDAVVRRLRRVTRVGRYPKRGE